MVNSRRRDRDAVSSVSTWTWLDQGHMKIQGHYSGLDDLKVGDYVLYNADAPLSFNEVERRTGYAFEGEAFAQSVAEVVALLPLDAPGSEVVGLTYLWRRGQIFAESDVHYRDRFRWEAEIFLQANGEVQYFEVDAIERRVKVVPYTEVTDLHAYERGPGYWDSLLLDRTRFWYRYAYDEHKFAFTSACHTPTYVPRQSMDLWMLDMFAGLGTVSLGARAAGWVPAHFVEREATACSSIALNFALPPGATHQLVIPGLTAKEFVEKIKSGSPEHPQRGAIDWLHASTPCVQLSPKHNTAPTPYQDDDLYHTLQAVELLDPPFVTFEQSAEFISTKRTLRPAPRVAGLSTGAAYDPIVLDDDDADDDDEEDEEVAAAAAAAEEVVQTPQDLAKKWNPFLLALFPLLDMGYQVRVRVHQLCGHGVPSMRLRTIIMAAKEGRHLPMPPPMRYKVPKYQYNREDERFHKGNLLDNLTLKNDARDIVCDAVTVEEAFGDLPADLVGQVGLARVPYHGGSAGWSAEGNVAQQQPQQQQQPPQQQQQQQPSPSPFAAFMRRDLQGTAAAEWLHHHHKAPDVGLTAAALAKGKCRLQRDAPANAILTKRQGKFGRELHPMRDRHITLAESMRLQSIPDGTQLAGSLPDQIKQVGNAVPGIFACEMGAMVRSAATGEDASTLLPPLMKAPRARRQGSSSSSSGDEDGGGGTRAAFVGTAAVAAVLCSAGRSTGPPVGCGTGRPAARASSCSSDSDFAQPSSKAAVRGKVRRNGTGTGGGRACPCPAVPFSSTENRRDSARPASAPLDEGASALGSGRGSSSGHPASRSAESPGSTAVAGSQLPRGDQASGDTGGGPSTLGLPSNGAGESARNSHGKRTRLERIPTAGSAVAGLGEPTAGTCGGSASAGGSAPDDGRRHPVAVALSAATGVKVESGTTAAVAPSTRLPGAYRSEAWLDVFRKRLCEGSSAPVASSARLGGDQSHMSRQSTPAAAPVAAAASAAAAAKAAGMQGIIVRMRSAALDSGRGCDADGDEQCKRQRSIEQMDEGCCGGAQHVAAGSTAGLPGHQGTGQQQQEQAGQAGVLSAGQGRCQPAVQEGRTCWEVSRAAAFDAPRGLGADPDHAILIDLDSD